jgi:hypothetical protein
MPVIHDIRFERLARQAPDHSPLPLSPEDRDYVLANLTAVGDAFGLRATPHAPLSDMTARGVVRHLAAVRTWLDPQTQEQVLALGRLESVYRLLASAVRVMELRSRRSA